VKGDRQKAVLLGQDALRFGYLAHVVEEHDFCDENLFYRFSDDAQRTFTQKTLAVVTQVCGSVVPASVVVSKPNHVCSAVCQVGCDSGLASTPPLHWTEGV
jgi:hypothetical protein